MIQTVNQNKSSVVNFDVEFVKEFAIFLFEKKAIKFGDFTLASGKNSSYYIDLRLVPSFPDQFQKMVKHLRNEITEKIGDSSFDSLVSVPTGGLVIASALAMEMTKPVIYVRSKPKDYGTSKSVEGYFEENQKVLMIDDVATTGGSVLKAIKSLKAEKIQIKDAFVIVNRLEGADEALEAEGVKMHHLADIIQLTEALFQENKISQEVFEKVKNQIENK